MSAESDGVMIGKAREKNNDGSELRLLKAIEVQDRLGLGRSKVYELMASGELPAVRLGPRVRRVSEEGLRRWIEERTFGLGAVA